jgi:hypothetical protein
MIERAKGQEDRRPWASPRDGVPIERREAVVVLAHGASAGLLGGLALGVVEVVASALLRGDPSMPFEFATALIVGPEALAPGFPAAASVALGTVIHLLLSAIFGVIFLAALTLMLQLSARPALMVVYGVLFGAVVWEVDFLAVLPLIRPELTTQFDLTTQLVNGIVSYCLVYGPVMAAYVIRVRPGVLDRWWLTATEAV